MPIAAILAMMVIFSIIGGMISKKVSSSTRVLIHGSDKSGRETRKLKDAAEAGIEIWHADSANTAVLLNFIRENEDAKKKEPQT